MAAPVRPDQPSPESESIFMQTLADKIKRKDVHTGPSRRKQMISTEKPPPRDASPRQDERVRRSEGKKDGRKAVDKGREERAVPSGGGGVGGIRGKHFETEDCLSAFGGEIEV